MSKSDKIPSLLGANILMGKTKKNPKNKNQVINRLKKVITERSAMKAVNKVGQCDIGGFGTGVENPMGRYMD